MNNNIIIIYIHGIKIIHFYVVLFVPVKICVLLLARGASNAWSQGHLVVVVGIAIKNIYIYCYYY